MTMKGPGCIKCPNERDCDAQYRGSRCAALRAKIGVDYDPQIDADHLRELARAEQEGRLVVPGAPVYVLLEDGTDYSPKTNGWFISEEKIGAVSLNGFYVGEPTDGVHFPYEQIGKTVFLTRQEAEAALKGVENEHLQQMRGRLSP